MKALAAISQIEQLVKMALENTDQQQKATPRSIRFPDEMDKRINEAMDMLVCDRTEIVVECVRMNFEAVLKAMLADRAKKAQKWQETIRGDHTHVPKPMPPQDESNTVVGRVKRKEHGKV